MQQLRHIRNIITVYTSLPGLILAAIGLYAVIAGAINILFVRWLYQVIQAAYPALADFAATIALILPYIFFVLVLYGIGRYYQHTYGKIEASQQVRRRLLAEVVIAGLAYLYSGGFNINLHWTVSIPLLVVAALLVVHWWLLAREQTHFLLLACLVVVLSFIPVFNVNIYHWLSFDTAPDWYYNNIGICAGLILTIAGLLSHYQMVQTLKHVRESIQSSS